MCVNVFQPDITPTNFLEVDIVNNSCELTASGAILGEQIINYTRDGQLCTVVIAIEDGPFE